MAFFFKRGGIAVLVASSIPLLLAPDAKAAPTVACGPGTNPLSVLFTALTKGQQFQCVDKLFTIGDPQSLVDTNDYTQNPLGGSLSFQWSDLSALPNYGDDLFSISLDFVPNLIGPRTGNFEYTIATTAAGYSFRDASLDSNVDYDADLPGNTTVAKRIYDPVSSTLIASLSSVDGFPNSPSKVPLFDYTEIHVIDEWSVVKGDTLDNIKNGFRQNFTLTPPESTVPGPLPLLGAGAAFGFSRRLRSRLLAARQG